MDKNFKGYLRMISLNRGNRFCKIDIMRGIFRDTNAMGMVRSNIVMEMSWWEYLRKVKL